MMNTVHHRSAKSRLDSQDWGNVRWMQSTYGLVYEEYGNDEEECGENCGLMVLWFSGGGDGNMRNNTNPKI